MKTKILLRALSLFLLLCSIISIFPVSAFATHEHGSDHCIDENCNTCDLPLVGEGITVALLDSGVQNYPVHTAVDFVGEEEVSSHGDEMAEVLLENAPGVTLLDVRVLNAEGVGDHSDVADGILWATEHGAQIIVMSFAGLENSRILKEAVEYAAEMGVVMVAAAGNDMKNTATFPAAYAQVLSVGALDAQGQISVGSNSGAYVDLYVEAQGGTSHAAQIVAANVAKLMQSRPEATSDEIYDELSTLVYKSDLLVEQSEDGTVYASAWCIVHKWGNWSTTRSATCTSAGEKVRYCSKCGKAKYETISALGHSVNSYPSVTVAPTCTARGYCTYRCRRCYIVMSTIYTPANGHSWGSYSVTRPATCTATGEKRRACTQCKIYDYSVTIPALGHSKSSLPSVTVKETCTTQGYSTYNCVRCKITMETKYTPAKGHSYGAYKPEKEATCTKTGLEVRECSRCGHEDTRIIKKLQHVYYTEEEQVVSGCVIEKHTYKKCRTCPNIFDEKEEITPNHDTRTRQYKRATCIEPEVIEVYCCKCDAHISYFYGDSPLDGHVPDYDRETLVVQEPNCIQCGRIRQWCKDCDQQFDTMTNKKEDNHNIETKLLKWNNKGKLKVQRYCTRCETDLFKGEVKLIDDQTNCDYSGNALGESTIDKDGCGVVAIYNLLSSRGIKVGFEDLINDAEKHALVNEGKDGTAASSMMEVYKKYDSVNTMEKEYPKKPLSTMIVPGDVVKIGWKSALVQYGCYDSNGVRRSGHAVAAINVSDNECILFNDQVFDWYSVSGNPVNLHAYIKTVNNDASDSISTNNPQYTITVEEKVEGENGEVKEVEVEVKVVMLIEKVYYIY